MPWRDLPRLGAILWRLVPLVTSFTRDRRRWIRWGGPAVRTRAFHERRARRMVHDLAVLGRRTANATFSNAHSTDQESAMQWAMDLTPLVQDDSLDPVAYTVGFIDRLKADVTARIRKSL